MTDKIAEGFRFQSEYCRKSGSRVTSNALQGIFAALDHSTRTGARILDWPGDPIIDALMLRIAGGLNALARSGRDAQLTALYASRDGDWNGIVGRILRTYDDWLYPWLDTAPQTNEVARSGALWPGMMEIARRFGPKLDIFELGASGGLNLNLDRYSYDLGRARSGDPSATVHLKPDWTGPSPAPAPVEIVARRGVDLNPLDLSNTAIASQMLAYIWPDQAERLSRAEAAIATAQQHPPIIDAGDGAEWIEVQLAKPQNSGFTRVVYHSIALQYFPPEGRTRVAAALDEAGKRATPERPLAWLAMEFASTVKATAELSLQCWPGNGAREHLADVQPHGAAINWNPENP